MLIPSLSDFLRTWNLFNTDTFELLTGQFHPEEMTMEIGSAYADKWALNRRHPITQFLRGELETIAFRSRFHATTSIEDLEDNLDTLKTWARKDEGLGRPPVLEFWVGNGSFNLFTNQCILRSLSGIQYDRPTLFGGLRQVTFTVNLAEYTEFSTEPGLFGNTRFHRARQGDYYELLTQREYGNPLIGDVIRKQNPDKPNVQIGNIIGLPAISKIRKTLVKPRSIQLKNAYERTQSAQRTNRIEWFDRRNVPHVSHVLKDVG